jgi:hypothetical protein
VQSLHRTALFMGPLLRDCMGSHRAYAAPVRIQPPCDRGLASRVLASLGVCSRSSRRSLGQLIHAKSCLARGDQLPSASRGDRAHSRNAAPWSMHTHIGTCMATYYTSCRAVVVHAWLLLVPLAYAVPIESHGRQIRRSMHAGPHVWKQTNRHIIYCTTLIVCCPPIDR